MLHYDRVLKDFSYSTENLFGITLTLPIKTTKFTPFDVPLTPTPTPPPHPQYLTVDLIFLLNKLAWHY